MTHATPQLLTVTAAAQQLGIPPSTLKDFERRGLVGPFLRDSGGRRLLTSADVDTVRHYLQTRTPKVAA